MKYKPDKRGSREAGEAAVAKAQDCVNRRLAQLGRTHAGHDPAQIVPTVIDACQQCGYPVPSGQRLNDVAAAISRGELPRM